MNTSLSEPDLRLVGVEEAGVEAVEEEEGESEDEGWYSLSRTDLRKLQTEVKPGGGHVNLVLTNCARSEEGAAKEEEEEEGSSQERNSYR